MIAGRTCFLLLALPENGEKHQGQAHEGHGNQKPEGSNTPWGKVNERASVCVCVRVCM